jgi:hypothetical protein
MFRDVRMGRITGMFQTTMAEAPIHAEMNITASVRESGYLLLSATKWRRE